MIAPMPSFKNPKIYVTTPDPTPYDRLQKTKRIAALIFVFVFAIGLFWLLFFSPVFAVSEILIEGPATEEIVAKFETFRGANIFRLDSERVEQELKASHPHLKRLAIFRGLPNALKVEVQTREEALVWESGGKRFLVDHDGYVFAEEEKELDLTLTEALSAITEQPTTQPYPDLPLVSDTRNAPLTVGTQLVSPEFVLFVDRIFHDFAPTTGITISALRVGETTFQIEVLTTEGFVVFFDTTRKSDPQLVALKKVLDTYRGQVHEYVDLRVVGKAYLK